MRKPVRILLVAALLVAASLPTLAQPADRSAIPIRQGILLTPFETAGSGIAPEVRLKVTVDARGAVSNVDVLDIKPASEFDEIFRTATIDTIRQWRYAPAIRDGEPVESVLQWSVQYRAKSEETGPGFTTDDGSDPLGPSNFSQIRKELQQRQEERRREAMERYSKAAEGQMDPLARRRFDSPRFVVVTDADDAETARVIAQNLEATYVLLDSLFQPKLEPVPERVKTLVYVFKHRNAFGKVANALRMPGGANAYYKPPGFILMHLELPSDEYVMHAILHEGFHAYSDSYLRRPGMRLPRWFEEGFAEYISNSKIKDGKLYPGETVRSKYAFRHNRSGVSRQKTIAGWSLSEIKKALRSGESIGVRQLLRTDQGILFGANGNLYYPASWLFVDFLRHGDANWKEEQFPTLLLYLAEGYPAKEVLETVYGLSIDSLDTRFKEHIKRL